MHTKLRRKGKRLLSAVGPKELLKVISDIYRGKGIRLFKQMVDVFCA